MQEYTDRIFESSKFGLGTRLVYSKFTHGPVCEFYLTHPFLDFVSKRSSNWHSAHARVGGALLGVSNFERGVFEAARHMSETVEAFSRQVLLQFA